MARPLAADARRAVGGQVPTLPALEAQVLGGGDLRLQRVQLVRRQLQLRVAPAADTLHAVDRHVLLDVLVLVVLVGVADRLHNGLRRVLGRPGAAAVGREVIDDPVADIALGLADVVLVVFAEEDVDGAHVCFVLFILYSTDADSNGKIKSI